VSAMAVPRVPLWVARGGTSTGAILRAEDVPVDRGLCEELLRHVMGTPLEGESQGNRQLAGLGRGIPTSNKVFIVRSTPGLPRLESTLAQLAANRSSIDWSVNCGNMSAALPLYAWESGLLGEDETGGLPALEIFNTNTGKTSKGQLELREGRPVLTDIPGVLGRFPRVLLSLDDPVGAKTGRLLPTGVPMERFDGVDASCVDVAVPMVIMRAEDLGKSGYETPQELDADRAFYDRLRRIWVEAGLRMGLAGRDGSPMTAGQLAASETIPKVCIVARPRGDATISARYFTPQEAHTSLAVSGACCLAAACLTPGTVAAALIAGQAVRDVGGVHDVSIENPAGVLRARIEAVIRGDAISIRSAAYERSAQILVHGSMPVYGASPQLSQFLRDR